VLFDQRLGLGKPERQIGIDGGFAAADHRGDLAGFADIAMRDPWRACRVQQRFRSGASTEIDAADVAEGEYLGGIDPWLAETGGRSTIRFRCTVVARFATGYWSIGLTLGICESPGSSEAFSNEDLDIPLAQALDG
jgi:hypothetical protein